MLNGAAWAGDGSMEAENLPVGARVWLLREGYSGRIVARAQGGLLYRVRREGRATESLFCPGCDLLRLHDPDRAAS